MTTTYTQRAQDTARQMIQNGHSYHQLATQLNSIGEAPPRLAQWNRSSSRHLCLSIGTPSINGPKPNTARFRINLTLGTLLDALPSIAAPITPEILSGATGLGLTTCRKYMPVLQLIMNGAVNQDKASEPYLLWEAYKDSVSPNDEASVGLEMYQ